MSPTAPLDLQVRQHQQTLDQLRRDLGRLENDYYGQDTSLGIRARVLVLWYGAASLLTVLGTVLGYVLRGIMG